MEFDRKFHAEILKHDTVLVSCNVECGRNGRFERRGYIDVPGKKVHPLIRISRSLKIESIRDVMLHELLHFVSEHALEGAVNPFRPSEGRKTDTISACGNFCGLCGAGDFCLAAHENSSNYERATSACSRCASEDAKHRCGFRFALNLEHGEYSGRLSPFEHPVVLAPHEQGFEWPSPLSCNRVATALGYKGMNGCPSTESQSLEECVTMDVITPYTCDDYYFFMGSRHFTDWSVGCMRCPGDGGDREAYCRNHAQDSDQKTNACSYEENNKDIFVSCRDLLPKN